jgi:membrane-bound serine protease (ClpP class)
MVQAVDQSKVPVAFFVHPAGAAATSAGAILLLASHVAAMAPGTNAGAAHPVGAQGEDIKGAMGEKVTQDVAAMVRGLAELRRRPVNLAEEMVTKSKSFSAQQAFDSRLVELIADSREDLIKKLEGRVVLGSQLQLKNAQVEVVSLSMGERILSVVSHPNIAAILMTLAMLLIYFELSAPGISIAGILGGLCMILGLMAMQALSVQTGGIVLLGLGVLLIGTELFAPSHGLFALGGVVSFILGLFWAFDQNSDLRLSSLLLANLGLGLGAAVFSLTWAAARTKRLTRQLREKLGGGGLAGLVGYTGVVQAVEGSSPDGQQWEGKATFRGEVWTVEASEPIAAGQEVVAERVNGFRVVVTPKKQ